MTRILPCPFCGRAPVTGPSATRGTGFAIECITAACIKPHVSYHRHAAAIRAWNKRGGVDLEQVERDQAFIREYGHGKRA
jgi:restriction alleviation protein Lar